MGEPEAPGRGGGRFFIENPTRGGGGSPRGGGRGGEGLEGVCGEFRGVGGLNNFFRGRNFHQEYIMPYCH